MTPRFLFFILMLMSCLTYGQAYKILDAFDDVSQYFTSNFPSGTNNIQISNTEFVEGTSSLELTYNIPAGVGNFVEVFRNYGTNTRDISFMPNSLSIQVLGNLGSSESFRYWLYEDIDMNGLLDGDDEIWYLDADPNFLNSSTFQVFDMEFSQFNKFSGSGNNQLDLNRIRGFCFTIINTTNNTISNTIYVDELKLNTTYASQSSGNSMVNGAFIQIWNGTGCDCGSWNQTRWEQELQKMKDVCIDELIIQYSIYDDNAWYNSSSQSYVNYTNSTLNDLFLAAENIGVKVKLGLYFDEHWNSADKSLQSTYDDLLVKHTATIDELYSLFGTSSAFNGWYIPQEINDLEWQNNSDRDKLANWLQSIANYAETKDASKDIIIAPFFNLWQPADVVGDWYENVLSIASSIDGVFPQDGVGITLKDIDTDVPLYFSEIKSACDANNVNFGATVENFQQINGWPINSNAFSAIPADIDRLKLQLWESSQFTNEIIEFSWSYMQSDVSVQNEGLYNDYSNYSDCSVTSIVNGYTIDDIVVKGDRIDLNLKEGEYLLYNISGQVVMSGVINDVDDVISISDLKAGIYILDIISGQTEFSIKVLKL